MRISVAAPIASRISTIPLVVLPQKVRIEACISIHAMHDPECSWMLVPAAVGFIFQSATVERLLIACVIIPVLAASINTTQFTPSNGHRDTITSN